QALPDGQKVTDTLQIQSLDGTVHTISIGVTGTNDQPTVSVQALNATEDIDFQFTLGNFGFTDTDTGEQNPDAAAVVHSFGRYHLDPHEEVQPCVQWTLHNEKSLYVNTVTLANDGGYHHSNWYIVPEDAFPGEDGFFNCKSRGFSDFDAAVTGSVLFAQSTQSLFEQQPLPEGVVIKVPPRHKVMAGTHLLNLSSGPTDPELRMTLDIVHPRLVDVVAAAFRLVYSDLAIPAQKQSRFRGSCDFHQHFESLAGHPLDIKLYYLLPHYHYLGNHFSVEVLGGPNDGQNVFELNGFNADANGQAFDPPLDLTGADGLRFTCGYNNWTNSEVGWGIGDQEMCMMLGLIGSEVQIDANVEGGSEVVGVEDGIVMNEGPCDILAIPKHPSQQPPTADEIDAPLYVPPSDPDSPTVPVDPCVDIDPALPPTGPATLSSIRETVFTPSCVFSSCHGATNPAAGLNLEAEDLYAELTGHKVLAATDLPLIDPGAPASSWLLHLMATCAPTDRHGNAVRHMPLNSPRLLDPGLVNKVRSWIDSGAPSN
ncbi:MAG: VCBS domain-containing protein, partial [Nannocystaceae bacterium]